MTKRIMVRTRQNNSNDQENDGEDRAHNSNDQKNHGEDQA